MTHPRLFLLGVGVPADAALTHGARVKTLTRANGPRVARAARRRVKPAPSADASDDGRGEVNDIGARRVDGRLVGNQKASRFSAGRKGDWTFRPRARRPRTRHALEHNRVVRAISGPPQSPRARRRACARRRPAPRARSRDTPTCLAPLSGRPRGSCVSSGRADTSPRGWRVRGRSRQRRGVAACPHLSRSPTSAEASRTAAR